MTRKILKFCRRQQKSKKTKKVCINFFPYSFSISISICGDSLLYRRGARTTFPKILRRLHKSVLQKITFLYYLMCRYQYKLRTPFYVWEICNFNPLLQYKLMPVPKKSKLCVTSQTNKSTNFLL